MHWTRPDPFRVFALACAIVIFACMLVGWRLRSDSTTWLYSSIDGNYTKWSYEYAFEWGNWFDLSIFNPFSGLGSTFWTNTPWLNPGALALQLPLSPLNAITVSYLAHLGLYGLTLYWLGRAAGASKLAIVYALSLFILLYFPPFTLFWFTVNHYSLAPFRLMTAAAANLVLLSSVIAIQSKDDRLWLVKALALGLLGLICGLYSSATYFVFDLLVVSGFFVVLLCCVRQVSAARRLLLLAAVLIIAFVASGMLGYLDALISISARNRPQPFDLVRGLKALILDESVRSAFIANSSTCQEAYYLPCIYHVSGILLLPPLFFSLYAVITKNVVFRAALLYYLLLQLGFWFVAAGERIALFESSRDFGVYLVAFSANTFVILPYMIIFDCLQRFVDRRRRAASPEVDAQRRDKLGLLPLSARGVRGALDSLSNWRVPLTRPRRAADLSPQAGRGAPVAPACVNFSGTRFSVLTFSRLGGYLPGLALWLMFFIPASAALLITSFVLRDWNVFSYSTVARFIVSGIYQRDAETSIVHHLRREVGLSRGGTFRGATATYLGNNLTMEKMFGKQDRHDKLWNSPLFLWSLTKNPHQNTGLWQFGIPTFDEYAHMITRALHTFTKELLTDPKIRVDLRIARAHELRPDILRMLGVRFVLADAVVDIRDFTEVERIEVRGGLPVDLFLYRLEGANVANWSPVDVRVIKDNQALLNSLKRDEALLRDRVFLSSDPPRRLYNLVPMQRGDLSFDRNEFRFQGASAGWSLALLPLQFSHCWSQPGSSPNPDVHLLRANYLLTGLLFEGTVDIRYKFDFGPWRSRCRKADAEMVL